MALHRCHAFLLNPKFMGILGYDSEDENSVEQGMLVERPNPNPNPNPTCNPNPSPNPNPS